MSENCVCNKVEKDETAIIFGVGGTVKLVLPTNIKADDPVDAHVCLAVALAIRFEKDAGFVAELMDYFNEHVTDATKE